LGVWGEIKMQEQKKIDYFFRGEMGACGPPSAAGGGGARTGRKKKSVKAPGGTRLPGGLWIGRRGKGKQRSGNKIEKKLGCKEGKGFAERRSLKISVKVDR